MKSKISRRYSGVDMIRFAKSVMREMGLEPPADMMDALEAYHTQYPPRTPEQQLRGIQKAFDEYERDIRKMSNEELYAHMYNGDYNPNDFASKEYAARLKPAYPHLANLVKGKELPQPFDKTAFEEHLLVLPDAEEGQLKQKYIITVQREGSVRKYYVFSGDSFIFYPDAGEDVTWEAVKCTEDEKES